VFAAIRELAALAGLPRRACAVSEPDKLAVLCAGDDLLLANLVDQPCAVRVADRSFTLEGFEVLRVTRG
jgi:hypothetical protein